MEIPAGYRCTWHLSDAHVARSGNAIAADGHGAAHVVVIDVSRAIGQDSVFGAEAAMQHVL
jgi:hypothetical protein